MIFALLHITLQCERHTYIVKACNIKVIMTASVRHPVLYLEISSMEEGYKTEVPRTKGMGEITAREGGKITAGELGARLWQGRG